MLIGKVVGTVVSSRKEENLVGLKFLLLKEADAQGNIKDKIVVAADAVGAGVGELVLFASGSSARQTVLTDNRPVDATIMAIIDLIEVEGAQTYHKQNPKT